MYGASGTVLGSDPEITTELLIPEMAEPEPGCMGILTFAYPSFFTVGAESVAPVDTNIDWMNSPNRIAATKNPRTTGVRFIIVVGGKKRNPDLETDDRALVMDYSILTFVELKRHAKNKHIKKYYIKSKQELIDLLSMKELPQSFHIEKMTVKELRVQAKEKGCRTVYALNRKQLLAFLYPTETPMPEEEPCKFV